MEERQQTACGSRCAWKLGQCARKIAGDRSKVLVLLGFSGRRQRFMRWTEHGHVENI